MLPRFTEKAVDFIKESDRAKKPFFLYFAPMTPHKPIVPNKPFWGRSKAGEYGDFVYELDWSVGELLKTLDRYELADNTLVVFTSDNGPETNAYSRILEYNHYSMGPLRGLKRDIWEGGHRIPFIARWAGLIKPGITSDEVICLTDLLATVAAIINYELPDNAGEDSYNILPVLLDKKFNKPIREATVHHSIKGNFAIRRGNWVLIEASSGDDNQEPNWFKKRRGYKPHEYSGELFNLKDDLAERKNLYGEYPEKVSELKEMLEKYKAEGRSVWN